MNERYARAAALLGLLLIASAPRPVRGTGLYSDLPWWFAPVDTARARMLAGQSWIRTEQDDASLFTFEAGIRTGSRTSVRIQLMYPVIRRPGVFEHGFGDALVFGELRAAGDTLSRSGLFLHGVMRLPSGSETMWPYAFESLDGGAGIELRRLSDLLDLRVSATGMLAGRRVRDGDRRHENFALLAAAIGIRPLDRAGVVVSMFSQIFRGGGYREVYLLELGVRASDRFDLRLAGGVDSGDAAERVFNSLVQFTLVFRFPPAAEQRPADDAPAAP